MTPALTNCIQNDDDEVPETVDVATKDVEPKDKRKRKKTATAVKKYQF